MKIRQDVEVLGGESKYLQDSVKYADISAILNTDSNTGQTGHVSSSFVSSHPTKDLHALKVLKFSAKLDGRNLLT